MLFNIFQQKNKQSKKQTKPQIIADIHEKNSPVFSNLIESGAELNIMSLEVGDFLIGETIIERKTFSDFISSMLNKRLMQQLSNMQKYSKRLLILEGKDFESLERSESKLNPNAIRGMMISTAIDFQTPIIFTKNSEETAKYLLVLAKRQLKKPTEITLHGRKGQTKKEKIEYIIQSFPRVGPKNAKALLKKFNSIKNIINAQPEQLKEILGKKAEEFIELLD